MRPLTTTEAATVEANLGLAGWAVQRWARHLPEDGPGYSRADAYQDAVIGLASAVQAFDPSTGNRLATFAAARMRSAIQGGMGRHEGVNHRRRTAHTGDRRWEVLPALNQPINDTDGSHELGEAIPDPRPAQAEMDATALRAAVEALRPWACADDLDNAILDAMLDPEVDWATSGPTVRTMVDRFGYTQVTVFERIRKMRVRLRDRLTADAA